MATFAAVVEAKSFTEAARVMGVSKSVVSGRVSRLEEQLGVRLILRTTRRFALTADGVRLYEKCARVVTAADQAAQTVADVSDTPRGVLRVHAPLALAQARLAAPLAELTRAYPGLRLDLRLDDRTPDLAKEGLDVALVMTERLAEGWLTAKKLAADRLVPCAAPGYLRRRGIPFRAQELVHHARIAREPWELTTEEGPLRFGEADLVVDSTAFMRDAALAEHGIALLPASIIADDLARGTLRALFDGKHDRPLAIYAVHLHERFVPARIRVFIDFLADHVKIAKAPAVKRRAAGAKGASKRRHIPMTEQDVRRLGEVAAVYKDVDAPGVERLERLLDATEVVTAHDMPANVVTMNSRCVVRERSGKERETSLVYPWDAGDDRVSVLSVTGEAMLGAPVGTALPAGAKVTAIRYQPEAAGDHHL